MNSDVQFFPQQQQTQRLAWKPEELTEALRGASPHVRYLLRELSEVDKEASARELKSKRVAYAIVQRICNSSGRDSLVLSRMDETTGEKAYRLNPQYSEQVKSLVRDAPVPPEEPAIRARKKKSPQAEIQRLRRTSISATDGIASSSSMVAPRRLAQGTSAHSLSFPPDVPLEFCQELIRFLNTSSNSTKYRMVLDSQGPKLETY